MVHAPPSSPSGSKFDGAKLLRIFLSYEDYWRLMIVLLAAGLLSGVGYYVFSRPTYSSTSVIRIDQFFNTAAAAQEGPRQVNVLRMRSLMNQLTSGFMILETGRRLQVAADHTTYLDLKASVIPAVRVSLLDQAHLQLTVFAFDPRVVSEFPEGILSVYAEQKAALRADFRKKAVERYMEELSMVRDKVVDQLDTRLKFEEQSALAGAQIELERLSNVPVELVRVRYRLEELNRIREVLQKQGDSLGTVGKLSLLTAVEGEGDSLASGRVVRRTGDLRSSPIGFESPETKKDFTQVVVQPDMVDGLEPWRELEKQKRGLEEQIRLTRAKFLDDHPEMRKLKEELKRVTSALELELDVSERAFELELDRLKGQMTELEKKLPAYHEATKNYDQKRLEYELLEKGQLAWDKAYEQLSKQIEGLEFASEDGSLDLEFRGFTDLRNETPVSPSKSKLAIMGMLLGIGLAGGVPFVLKKLDSSVSSLEEFEQSLGIPGIGLIPVTDPAVLEEVNRSPAIGADVPNALLENFRLIRSSIMLNRSPKGDARVVMVTSARPAEGKTTVAANIAWAFASAGEKTLLIDCDLRRGRVHGVTGLVNNPGLTDLLVNRERLGDSVQQSVSDKLWVIPRGSVVAGTTELLNTPVFSNLLDTLKSEFDRIILDTPPVLGLSETSFLQNFAEGVVLVVRSGRTKRKDVEDAFHALSKLGGHFYGFVLNGVDFSKKANHYQYYYYSASYYDDAWDDDVSRSEDCSEDSANDVSKVAIN